MSAADGVRVARALVLSLIVWMSIGGEVNQILVAQAAGSRGSPPETALAVSTATPDGPRITPYLRAQLDRAWRQDARRQARFDAVATEADLLALRGQVAQSMLDAIGGLPETRMPLNARTVGTERMDGYRIERVIFESLPGIHVTALVYVPDAPPASASASTSAPAARRPAVLLACGHSPLGKAFVNYQRLAARLARLGFIVICWDPVGQGERSQFWDASRKSSRYDLVCGEHAILGNLATLAGANIARWMIWDGIRALDYLLARGDVDPARVAITGTSGGGFQSVWIGALDPRIAVIAPSAFISSLPMRMANRIFDDPASDPEQDPHGLVSAGVDHAGLLLAAYPRPVHVSAAVLDFFPIEGTRLTVRTVRALDTRVGHGNRVALAEGYHKHAYSDENQLSAFAFIARAFDLPAVEALPEVSVLPPERLRCTKSGQVREDLPGRGLVDEIRAYYDAHKSGRTLDLAALYRDAAKDEDGVDAAASSWDIVPDRGQSVGRTIAWTLTGSSTTDDVVIDRYRLRHHGRQTVPLLHIRRAVPASASAPSASAPASAPAARRTVIHVDLRGKVTAASWHRVRALLDAGMDVVSVDLPATGELRMRFRVETEPHLKSLSDLDLSDHPVASVLANHAYNGLLTGRPYLIDALQTIEVADRFARAQLRASDVALSGAGQAATLAVAASTVWPSLALLSAPDADPFDWQTVVQRGTELWPIHYLLPGGAYARLRPAAAPPAPAQSSPSQSSPSIAIAAPVLFDTPEADAILGRLQVFPADNPWNQDISRLPVHRDSAAIVASIGLDKPLDFNLDMNFIIVPPDQRRVDVELVQYPNESDPGPFPIPDNAPIENWPLARNEATGALPTPGQTLDSFQREGTGDRHLLVVDPVNGKLHELYRAYKTDKGWRADNAATFDLRTGALRPERWTSADAAGLPIFPAVVRYDEVAAGLVRHAMRVTVRRTRRGYVLPATHWASRSTDPSLPRMGERLRLKAGFDTSGFPPHARAVLEGLKRYGMFVADNGRDWLMSIAPDRRFEGLETLTRVKGSDFEVVETGARSVEDR